jgi:hypothetical protein
MTLAALERGQCPSGPGKSQIWSESQKPVNIIDDSDVLSRYGAVLYLLRDLSLSARATLAAGTPKDTSLTTSPDKISYASSTIDSAKAIFLHLGRSHSVDRGSEGSEGFGPPRPCDVGVLPLMRKA